MAAPYVQFPETVSNPGTEIRSVAFAEARAGSPDTRARSDRHENLHVAQLSATRCIS